MIPWQMRRAVRSVLDMPLRRRALLDFAGISMSEDTDPVLGFGGVPDGGGLIHGGAVKLLSLREGFPHDERKFNTLYLVSSAQPRFARELVRVCRSLGIKFVWNQNGVGYAGWAGCDAEAHNASMRELRVQADFVVYQSSFCRESADKFLGSSRTPSSVLFNPVDLKKFSPRRQSLPPRPLRLLAMGTQNYRERVVSVLECLHSLREEGIEATLTIAGPLIWKDADGDVRETVASLGLADSVSILPPFRQEDAPGIYRDHHILLHPKYMDPCPTVVAEALACGLPVVASRSGGIPEMVDGHCAVLIDVPFSWDRLFTPTGQELAEAVNSVAPDLPAFSRHARRQAEVAFDQGVWISRHEDIFRSLLVSA
jgi:glycosyltransferase involved in cell wall biosynthesis